MGEHLTTMRYCAAGENLALFKAFGKLRRKRGGKALSRKKPDC